MSRSQSVVSIYYNAKQDRLSFLLAINEQEQVEGIMTRRLLKSMLIQFPVWLSKQDISNTANQHCGVVTSIQEHGTNQFQYPAAQSQVKNSKVIKINHSTKVFLIDSINVSSIVMQGNNLGIVMIFFSDDKPDTFRLVFSLEQFYQFIAAVLVKVSEWNLTNPWLIENFNRSKVIH